MVQLSVEFLKDEFGEDCLEVAFSLGLPSAESVSRHPTPFMKTRLGDGIYLDCHLLVEIHLRNKICCL